MLLCCLLTKLHLTLCEPMYCSKPGFPSPPLLCVCVKSLSHVQLFVTPWTAAHQAPPSMEGFINILYIHVFDYNGLNYGKYMHHRACHYVTYKCQSKLSDRANLNENIKVLSLKHHPCPPQHLTFLCQCLFWFGTPLPCGVLSVLSLINFFLLRVRPSILLCVLAKNCGPQGKVFFDPPLPGSILNQRHVQMCVYHHHGGFCEYKIIYLL